MSDERLSPKNLHITLPALTIQEAERLLSLIDELQRVLWDAYGDHVVHVYANRPDDQPTALESDDDLPW
jgi:hypothetical protein